MATVFLLEAKENRKPDQRSFLPLKRSDLIIEASQKAQKTKEVRIF